MADAMEQAADCLPPMPPRYVPACDGDEAEARRRWAMTCKWRRENNIDATLRTPHPQFFRIKAHYPHFFHLRGKSGHIVYFEQAGRHTLPALFDKGVEVEQLKQHYVFLSEYQWAVVDPVDTARMITVYDLKGTYFSDLTGVVLTVFRSVSKIYQDFYPERSFQILIVNCPGWFTMFWRAGSAFISANTKKKLRIVGERDTLPTIAEFVDTNQLPPEYGGPSDALLLGASPTEAALRDLVLRACHDAGVEPVEMPPDVQREWDKLQRGDQASAVPPTMNGNGSTPDQFATTGATRLSAAADGSPPTSPGAPSRMQARDALEWGHARSASMEPADPQLREALRHHGTWVPTESDSGDDAGPVVQLVRRTSLKQQQGTQLAGKVELAWQFAVHFAEALGWCVVWSVLWTVLLRQVPSLTHPSLP